MVGVSQGIPEGFEWTPEDSRGLLRAAQPVFEKDSSGLQRDSRGVLRGAQRVFLWDSSGLQRTSEGRPARVSEGFD